MAEANNTPYAQPFLKWAGGKGQLLEQYQSFLPRGNLRAYCEPFVGSGAVFFHLRRQNNFKNYHLSDVNEELINCYRAVRDNPEELIAELEWHENNHKLYADEHYYPVRNWDHDPEWSSRASTTRAARMIYLNKTCYNGLWRVNSKGQFNVPMGRYTNPDILNPDRIELASKALQGVELSVQSFTTAVMQAGPGDFIYFDPPYMPLSNTANFTSYSADSFGPEDQRELANVFADLAQRGCLVMLSNSDTDFIRQLYANFRIKTLRFEIVEARRAISSKGKDRGPIPELVVLNY